MAAGCLGVHARIIHSPMPDGVSRVLTAQVRNEILNSLSRGADSSDWDPCSSLDYSRTLDEPMTSRLFRKPLLLFPLLSAAAFKFFAKFS